MLLGICAVVITSCKGVCPARSEVMCAVYDCGLDTQRLFPFECCRRKGTKQIVHAAKARSRDLNLALTNAKSSLWMLQTFEKCFLFAWSRCRLMSTPSGVVDRHNQPAAWCLGGALDQFLSSPHVVTYPAVVTSCSAELCCVLGKDGLRYRLRTSSYHTATDLFSHHTSHTVHEEIGTTSNTGLSETSHVQFA